MKFLCCILWCQRFRDRGLKLFSSTYWLQAIMGRLFSLSEVMMGRRKGKRKLWSFQQKRCQLTFHLAVKTPSWLLNKNYTYFWILDLITALLCLCLHLFFFQILTDRKIKSLFIHQAQQKQTLKILYLSSHIVSSKSSASHRGEQCVWGQLILVLLAYQKLSQSSFKFF